MGAGGGLADTFCALPWTHLEVVPDGTCKLCCVAQELVREGRVALNVEQRSIEEIRRSGYMRSVREGLLGGRRVRACSTCWTQEARGETSQRQVWNERFPSAAVAVAGRAERGQDPLEPLDLQYLQLSLGNTCNLACRMCNASYSSRIAEDPEHVKWAPGQLEPVRARPALAAFTRRSRSRWRDGRPWFEQAEFFGADLLEQAPALELLTVTGGEPLMSAPFERLLAEYAACGRAAGMVVRISSNLFHNEARLGRVMEALLRFRHCSVGASVDGLGTVFEYIRYPARWPIVERNLRLVRELALKSGRVTLTLDTVVQPYNCLNLVELLRFADELGLPAFPHAIEGPTFLGLRVVPEPLRREAAARLRRYAAAALPSANREHALRLAQHFEDLRDDAGTLKARWHFRAFTRALDASRGQKLAECVPELAAAVADLPPLPWRARLGAWLRTRLR